MGILSGFNDWLRSPGTQMALGPLAQAFGAPQGFLGPALAQASGQMAQARLEEQRRLEEERRRQERESLELEDRELRRRVTEERLREIERARAGEATQRIEDARQRETLRDMLFEAGLDPDMADADETGARTLLRKTHELTITPEDPSKPGAWSQVSGGRAFYRTGAGGDLEFGGNPYYEPEPDEDALPENVRALLRQRGLSEDEIDLHRTLGTLEDVVQDLFGQGKGGGGGKNLTGATLLADLNSLVDDLQGDWYGDVDGAMQEVLRRADRVAASGRTDLADPLAPRDPLGNRDLRTRPPGDPRNPLLREYLSEEAGGSLVADAAAALEQAPPAALVRQHRGGVTRQTPEATAGQERAGLALEDPEQSPVGNATVKPVQHGGQRRTKEEATAEASLELTLQSAEARFPPEVYSQIAELAAQARAEGATAAQIEQLIRAALGD